MLFVSTIITLPNRKYVIVRQRPLTPIPSLFSTSSMRVLVLKVGQRQDSMSPEIFESLSSLTTSVVMKTFANELTYCIHNTHQCLPSLKISRWMSDTYLRTIMAHLSMRFCPKSQHCNETTHVIAILPLEIPGLAKYVLSLEGVIGKKEEDHSRCTESEARPSRIGKFCEKYEDFEYLVTWAALFKMTPQGGHHEEEYEWQNENQLQPKMTHMATVFKHGDRNVPKHNRDTRTSWKKLVFILRFEIYLMGMEWELLLIEKLPGAISRTPNKVKGLSEITDLAAKVTSISHRLTTSIWTCRNIGTTIGCWKNPKSLL